ncbi:hypothetical protein [Zooshikella ganghwensis]|uniref:hypothetical protein n=1 Tax=Zooshikella ganghwensis TaxID=202772 RepID=UPI00041FFF11|nr:hypothetical protein [Zooshikella ganghwensis]
MITNLDELVSFLENIAAKFPIIASEIKLCSPGYSDEILVKLRQKAPYLPDSYFDVIKKVKIAGISIGQLNLWPVPYGKKDFVTSIIEANTSSDNPFLDFYRDKNLVEVARLEANIICLSSKSSKTSGYAYLVDISSGPNLILKMLANSFEQLLIIAGNLYDISLSYENNEEVGMNEFKTRLAQLGVDSNTSATWQELLEEFF